MKVLLVNGSPRARTAAPIPPSARSPKRWKKRASKRKFSKRVQSPCRTASPAASAGKRANASLTDAASELAEKAKTADGFVFGSPVYYAHPAGQVLSLLDRAFYSGGAAFAGKPGAAIVSARRGGTAASFDVLNKYFTICQMPVVSSHLLEHGLRATRPRR